MAMNHETTLRITAGRSILLEEKFSLDLLRELYKEAKKEKCRMEKREKQWKKRMLQIMGK